ncbi:glycosyltransferase [bacterium]|nr:MAG: glycosyltransferase [bacterium]
MKKLNILFLLPRYPFPLIGGDRVKPYYIIKYLAKNHNVTLVTFFQGKKFTESLKNSVLKLGVDLHVLPLKPMNAGISSLPRLISKKPLEILYYEQKQFRDEVNKLLEDKNFDLAFAFFMRTAEYIKDVDVPSILMAEDCRTEYQKRSFKGSKNLKQKLVRFWEWKKLARYEPEIVEYFDAVTLVSQEDIELMRNLNPKANYKLLSNGVDTEKFIPDEKVIRENLLFTGKMDVWANELMINRIVNEILPIVKQQFPKIKLILAGANPSKSIKKFEGDDVEIYSNVPEIVSFLQKAAVYVHPHYGGSGIQNKLLEAMSSGCPVVTTTTGNQGIYARNGEEILIADSSEEIAQKVIELLKNKELANKISKNARNHIVKSHSWEAIYEQCDKIMNEVCGLE